MSGRVPPWLCSLTPNFRAFDGVFEKRREGEGGREAGRAGGTKEGEEGKRKTENWGERGRDDKRKKG